MRVVAVLDKLARVLCLFGRKLRKLSAQTGVLFCAGAPAGRELCEDVRKRMPHIKFVSQEITLACTLPVYGTKQTFGNVSQIAASTQVRIVDTVTQKPLEPEQRGEIYVKSASVMLGYLNRPEATAAAIDDDGWLRTGDIGFVDRRGFLFIVDRLKEWIKVKGLQVPPAELEDLLLTHPLIEDAAVVGVPHERDGERPMAFLVRANEALCEEEVRKYVADRVAPYKHLKGGVHFLPQIPKLPSGKILRRFLRDEAAALRKAAKL